MSGAEDCRWDAPVVLLLATCSNAHAYLCVAENDLAGHGGEDPPPIGQLSRFDIDAPNGSQNMEDPVWISASDGSGVFVSLFHSGQIVRYDITSGKPTVIATNLSCPEGVVIDWNGKAPYKGSLYVNENPIGNECKQDPAHMRPAATLTRIDMGNASQHINVTGLFSPHGLAPSADSESMYVCEWGLHQLSRVTLSTGEKTRVAPLRSPSGCAIDGAGYAYAVEQGDPGALVRIRLSDGSKTTLIDDLAGPNGVAVGDGYAYATERAKNAIRRVKVEGGQSEVFAKGLKSPFGLAMC